MRAWRYLGGGKPLTLEDVPEPTAGPGQVVVKLAAAGLCHSDLHILSGQFPFPAPLTLGHEGAGVIEAVGDGVSTVAVGDRVAVYGGVGCGQCKLCGAGREHICENRGHVGLQADGCFADKIGCPELAVVPLPDNVSFEAGAVAVDAVLTPYHGLKTVGKLQAGERCAIFGIGGLGHNAVQIAKHLGAWVAAIDPSEAKREMALQAGADVALPDAGSLFNTIDIAGDFVGVEASILGAQLSLSVGGRMVLCGLGSMQAPLIAARFGAQEVAILGSFWGSRQEVVEILDLISAGKLDPVYETHDIETITDQVHRLENGEVAGRVVLHV